MKGLGESTSIAWCDHSWNPWWRCTKVSPGCDHCYADTFSKRVGFSISGKDAPRRFFGDKHWSEPLKWNAVAKKEKTRRRVFCASMCDVMEDRDDLTPHRLRLYQLIEATPHLDWLLLTKRPQNFVRFLPTEWLEKPQPNVWGMTTVESSEYLWRAIELAFTPFAIRGISYEPALGPIDLTRVDYRDKLRSTLVDFARWNALKEGRDPEREAKRAASSIPAVDEPGEPGPFVNLLTGYWFDGWDSGATGRQFDWLICGGESGAGARPMNSDWARSARDQCRTCGAAFFMKQMGGVRDKRDRLEDLPEDLRIREFPQGGSIGSSRDR